MSTRGFIHYQPANSSIGELIVAGYERALNTASKSTASRNAITVPNIINGNDPTQPQITGHLLDGEKDPAKVIAVQQELAKQVREILLTIKQYENNPATKAVYLSSPVVQQILHNFGDAFAHAQANGAHYSPGLRHTVDSKTGNDPDDPYINADAYKNYVSTLFSVDSQVNTIPRVSNSTIIKLENEIINSAEKNQTRVLDNAIGGVTPAISSGLVNFPVNDCGELNACSNKAIDSQVNSEINKVYGVKK